MVIQLDTKFAIENYNVSIIELYQNSTSIIA